MFELPGWRIYPEGDTLRIIKDHPLPVDSRDPSQEFLSLYGITPYTPDDVPGMTRRVFSIIQYLTDHELREHFLVNGERVFDPHNNSIVSRHHDFFVGQQGAVDGGA